MRLAIIFASLLGTAIGSVAIGACGGKAAPVVQSPTGERPLFDRLGALTSITQIVDDFLTTVQSDDRINQYFNADDPPKLKAKLVDQFCFYADGPCKYEGKNLRATHAEMGITGADFDYLVEDLKAALTQNRVQDHEQQQLLDKLGVNDPPAAPATTQPESAGSSS